MDDQKKPTNPKDALGIKKVPMHCVSCAVMAELGLAMMEGGRKYGTHNYRAMGVRGSVYYDAVFRHMMSWWEGQDVDPDSGVSHVTKAIACLVVLRDSMIMENWEDDRPIRLPDGLGIDQLNKMAADIITKYPVCVTPYLEIGTKIHEEIERVATADNHYSGRTIPVHDYSGLCYCENCQARRNAG